MSCSGIDSSLPDPVECQETIRTSAGEKPLDDIVSDIVDVFAGDDTQFIDGLIGTLSDALTNYRTNPELYPSVDDFITSTITAISDDLAAYILDPESYPEIGEFTDELTEAMGLDEIELTETERTTEIVEISSEENPDCVVEVERITSITFEGPAPNGGTRSMKLNFTGWEDD